MNYKLIIQYDGTRFSGWQTQKNALTVQRVISDAIETITREKINLIGSGRTDTGVHALGQVANFRISGELDIPKFKHSLNSLIPDSIAVRNVDPVPDGFHARFDAKKRTYLYFIILSKSPFYCDYTYYFPPASEFKIDELNRISKVLMGSNDFTSFARKETDKLKKVCEIYDIRWKRRAEIIVFKVEADRFLHGMVRTILGTLFRAVRSDHPEDYIMDILRAKNRTEAGEAVPAKGLFLYRVKY